MHILTCWSCIFNPKSFTISHLVIPTKLGPRPPISYISNPIQSNLYMYCKTQLTERN